MADIGLFAAPAFRTGSAGRGSVIVELTSQRSIVSISTYQNCLERLQSELGVVLPPAGQSLSRDGVTFLWSGAASWLAIAGSDEVGFEARLAERSTGLAAVTDQSDGRAILRVQGAAARNALAKLVPIDLHPSVFTVGATALTLAGHIAVQIWRVQEDTYELACFRSFAEALYEALIEASREYENDVVGRG